MGQRDPVFRLVLLHLGFVPSAASDPHHRGPEGPGSDGELAVRHISAFVAREAAQSSLIPTLIISFFLLTLNGSDSFVPS